MTLPMMISDASTNPIRPQNATQSFQGTCEPSERLTSRTT